MAEATIETAIPATPDAAPAERVKVSKPRPPWRISATRALWMFGAGFATLLIGAGAAVQSGGSRYIIILGQGAFTAVFAFSFVRAIVALVRMRRAADEVPIRWPVLVSIFPLVGGAFMTLFGAVLTLFSSVGFARGRQIRRRGQIMLPPVEAGGDWARLELPARVEPALASALADRWRENGRTEHASVAAFAHATLDLMALGAPASLIEAANHDARDEIRHAELCFSLARALDGKTESPGAFPEARRGGALPHIRTLALARLSVDSLVDGALHEGISARVIARLVKRCQEPAIREVLRELAADEGRHAAHGWDVVEWCLAQGGRPVAQALLGALEALPTSIESDLPAGAREGAWERYGIHGAALEAEEHQKARADLIERVRALAMPV